MSDEHTHLLADALGDLLVAIGVASPDVPLTGPQLLALAADATAAQLRPTLTFRNPDCPRCREETGFDGTSYWCEGCGSTWDDKGCVVEGPEEARSAVYAGAPDVSSDAVGQGFSGSRGVAEN